MLRKTVISLAGFAALAMSPAPAMAQDEPDMTEIARMGAMFEVEPLTAEQKSRLPMAQQIVSKIMPPGTLDEVMGGVFDGLLGPVMEMANSDTGAALSGALGYQPGELGLDNAAATEVLAIVDPAWRERNRAVTGLTQSMTRDMMTRMEPIMREVMAELYAIHFTEQELVDIDAFFSTESGLAYARQSYSMAADPRIMAALFAEPDVLFGPMTQMPAMLEQALADIPAVRSFADLPKSERSRLTELTGLSAQELEQGMQAAAEARESGM
ncbi:DUF2059 domain-containing protein [Aurantiacibacter hainanensis]|uniref:DUF2059 domain-containing protein n=1 Tax=Aurantiacibacter hainanensis TaxID=3076114 RepID=UPI0030C6FF47